MAGTAGKGIESTERPMVEVYSKAGELLVCCTLQELIVKAFFRNVDLAEGLGDFPWPVTVAGVCVAPITPDVELVI